jgi:CRP/FNR family transcriptional regulator
MSNIGCNGCAFKSSAGKALLNSEFTVLEENSALVNFKKGDLIFKQGALSTNVAYLRTGLVKLHMRGPSSEKILRIVKAPSYFGIPTNFGDKINKYSATALDITTVCFIDSNLFRNFILKNGKFAYEVIVELCENELNDYERYANQSQKQVHGMVAEALICMSDKIFKSNRFNLPLTQSELGNLVGNSRESVSRVLSDFNKNNIIEFKRKEINIINREVLLQISEKG